MPRCFVIQPFDDGGGFDKRFDDVIAPALERSDIEPYRVDRDPRCVIPIETIERNIRDADYCLADISSDNPNVWFEVGYSLACNKDIILICSDSRKAFPFDIRHRTIITYTTESSRDFNKLSKAIQDRLDAFKKNAKTIIDISPIKDTEGLSPHEMRALILLMNGVLEPNGGLLATDIKQGMERAGFNATGTVMALKQLQRKKFIELEAEYDSYNQTPYSIYRVTESGVEWCFKNESLLNLKFDPPPKSPAARTTPPALRRPTPPPPPDDEEEDIPF